MFSLANLTRPEADPKIIATGPSAVPAADRMARGLGWFSIGLGVTELVAAPWLTRLLGLRGREGLVRAFGLREIAAGMLTLSTETRTGIASRIIGDGLDLAVLATALGPHNRKRDNAALALALVGGITLLDIATSKALEAKHGRRGTPKNYADRSGFPRGRAGQGLIANASEADETPGAGDADGSTVGAGAEPSPGNDAGPIDAQGQDWPNIGGPNDRDADKD